jgi:hypothetical protein
MRILGFILASLAARSSKRHGPLVLAHAGSKSWSCYNSPMRKLLLFLLALPLMCAQSVTVSVSPASISSAGGTATLTLTFADASPSVNMAGVQWTLTPPSGATIGTPAAGAASTGKVISCGTGSFAALCVDAGTGTTLNAMAMSSGILATLPVTIAAGVTSGPLSFALTGLLGANTAGSAVTLTTTAAILTITSKYDLNGDGLVNSADVQIMLNDYLTGTCPGAIGAGSPANGVGDGKCDVEDIVLEIIAAL